MGSDPRVEWVRARVGGLGPRDESLLPRSLPHKGRVGRRKAPVDLDLAPQHRHGTQLHVPPLHLFLQATGQFLNGAAADGDRFRRLPSPQVEA